MSKREEIRKQKRQTKAWLKERPNIHYVLFTHHQLTRKANNIDEPNDNELITFTWPNGDEYNIKYGKLKELAEKERVQILNENTKSDTKGAK